MRISQLGIDIPRWKKISGKKYWFEDAYSTRNEADKRATAIRKSGEFARVIKHKESFILGTDKKSLRYSVWGTWSK